MSISGVSASYWSVLNRVSGTQQRVSATAAITDIAQPSASTTVSISPEARAAAAALTANNTQTTDHTTVSLNTSDGKKDIDIDAYFNPSANAAGWSDGKSLPPLLLPSPDNINALAKDASSRLKTFLAANHIPAAPSSISYDASGQMQLPSDYQYADQLKQALKDNTVLERELSTVNALTSQLVSMRGSADFSEEYSKATTKAEVDTILAKYHSLFDGTQHQYKISLGFDGNGNISPLADGQPYADLWTSPKTVDANSTYAEGNQQNETSSPSVQAHLDEIKSKPAMTRTQEDFEYQIAHDKKLAQIKAKDANSRTADEIDYEQKALGFVNTMAGLNSTEKALYDQAVASGNTLAAEALSKIGFLRVTSNQAGGFDGSTYDPSKLKITPETIANFFSQSFVDPSHETEKAFQALSDFLRQHRVA